jgi:hypothetical protein
MNSTANLLRKYADILSEAPIPTPGTAPAAGAPAAPGAAPAAGQAAGGVDPKQAAAMIKQQADQKKAIQDQIKQAEQSLIDLRKQLASIGK